MSLLRAKNFFSFRKTDRNQNSAKGFFKKFFSKRARRRHDNLDKALVYSLAPKKIPGFGQLKHFSKTLTAKERFWVRLLAVFILLNGIFLASRFYTKHLQVLPENGGDYSEAIVGTPKYINPLYSVANDVDSDISALVFSSLFKRDRNGSITKDLVEDFSVSDDKKVYDVKIRKDVLWHNGEKLTADDIIFTFNAIKDQMYKSPLRPVFLGAEIERVDDYELKFNLIEPYPGFLDLLTFGIIPENIWLQIDPQTSTLADYNIKPIGSGPYKFKSLSKNKSGEMKDYVLERNDDYYGHVSYLDKITFKFFANSSEAISALNNNAVDGLNYLPFGEKSNLISQDSLWLHKLNLPRLTAVFFNQKNNTVLSDVKLRQALAFLIDKNNLIKNVLDGDALAANGPLPEYNFAYNQDIKKYDYNVGEADRLLTESGWNKISVSKDDEAAVKAYLEDVNPKKEAGASEDLIIKTDIWKTASSTGAEFAGAWRYQKPNAKKGGKIQYITIRLTVVDSPESLKLAQEIKKAWELEGIKVILNEVPSTDVQSEVIKPRNFEALIFSQIVGSDPDSFAFWHSSQIGEGGFNIAGYKNKEVDTLLESARTTSVIEERIQKYKKFQEIISNEVPAIFLYYPHYTYIQSKRVKGFDIKNILEPYDRFGDATYWYVKTSKKIVW